MSRILLAFLFVLSFAFPLLAQQVDTAWVRRYKEWGITWDQASDIAVNSAGDVYVTGQSYNFETEKQDRATIKYYPNGDTAWIRLYSGVCGEGEYGGFIGLDLLGNIYVTGASYCTATGYDITTIKYQPNGDTGWVRRFNGPANHDDWVSAIAIDGFNNCYVTGSTSQLSWQPFYSDFATVKYYPDGDTAWVRTYNGVGNTYDSATAMVVDQSGYVYVTGVSYGGSTKYDYLTIKYTPEGDTVWVRRYNGPASMYDKPEAIAVDGFGNVYVTGYSMGNGTFYDYATIKYDSTGTMNWVKRYSESGNYDDRAYALVLDDSGDTYVAGTSYANSTSYDCVIIKYLPNGDTAWTRRYDGQEHGNDQAKYITADHAGNIYVTGSSEGIETYRDYVTISYDQYGNMNWVSRYNAPGNHDDYPTALSVDDSGYTYVTGVSSDFFESTQHFATIKYDRIPFYRGDADRDGVVTMSDIIYLISYLFKHGPAPAPLPSGDANCDGKITVADAVYLINYLLKGGPAPAC